MNQIKQAQTITELIGALAADTTQTITIDGAGYEHLTVLITATGDAGAEPALVSVLQSDQSNANFVALEEDAEFAFAESGTLRRDITLIGKKRYIRITITTDSAVDDNMDALAVISIKAYPDQSPAATAAGLIGSGSYGQL